MALYKMHALSSAGLQVFRGTGTQPSGTPGLGPGVGGSRRYTTADSAKLGGRESGDLNEPAALAQSPPPIPERELGGHLPAASPRGTAPVRLRSNPGPPAPLETTPLSPNGRRPRGGAGRGPGVRARAPAPGQHRRDPRPEREARAVRVPVLARRPASESCPSGGGAAGRRRCAEGGVCERACSCVFRRCVCGCSAGRCVPGEHESV